LYQKRGVAVVAMLLLLSSLLLLIEVGQGQVWLQGVIMPGGRVPVLARFFARSTFRPSARRQERLRIWGDMIMSQVR
jgi:hypothetical protein